MPLHLLHNLKTKAGELAYSSFLYNWSLSGILPDRLVVKPVDPWPGDSAKAKALLDAAGVGDRTGPVWYDEWWRPEGVDDIWRSHMHGFSWLRDLRALDGAIAREQGRVMIESWINRYGTWHANSWKPELIGRRLSMWICHYEFFCANADFSFEEKFLSSIVKQAKHLSNSLGKVTDIDQLEAIKGLLYASIALEGHEKWIEQALADLQKSLALQILEDGGHISRSPATLLNALEIMVDIRSTLNFGGYPIPHFLSEVIEKMSSALRTVRHRDRKLALFHGTQEGEENITDSILAQAGTHKKAKQSLPESGYERMELGRSLIILDTGTPPPSPYDKLAHASPLAFEMSYGKKRLFVSCGSHPTSPEWYDALRSTAAHNTAILDMRNSCEIKNEGHFGRKATHTTVHREDSKDAVLLIASHNGYVPLNGITHTRKLYMTDEGNDIRGEDDLSCAFDLVQPVDIALRFHLHPDVTASLVNDNTEVLLRMPGGAGWRFHHSVGVLSLDDSLYLGEGITPRKTKQIVIYNQMTDSEARIKWAVKREG